MLEIFLGAYRLVEVGQHLLPMVLRTDGVVRHGLHQDIYRRRRSGDAHKHGRRVTQFAANNVAAVHRPTPLSDGPCARR